MSERWARIDARRQEIGLSIDNLARTAGLSPRTLYMIAAGKRQPRRDTIRALECALVRHRRRHAEGSSRTYAAYRLALLQMARLAGIDLDQVDAADPERRATNNPEWAAASVVRRRAIYLVNVIFGVGQHELAAVTGLTPAAVSLACRAIEDDRDIDPALDRVFDDLAAQLMGSA